MNKIKKKFTLPTPVVALVIYTFLTLALILSLKYITVVAAPLFFAFIIAYLFNPAVNFFEKRIPLKRGVTAGILMITLVFVMAILIINLFPYVVDQLENAAEKFPEILKRFSGKVQVVSEYITKNFPEYVGQVDLMGKVEEMLSSGLTDLSKILIAAFSSLYSVIMALIYLVFVPLFSYYFLKDYRKIQRASFDLIPYRLKEKAIVRVEKLDDILSSFIRGQAIVVFILAVLYSLGLSLIGLPFAILIGVFAGFGDIIPYFGTVLGLLVSLVVGFTYYDSIEKIFLIFLVFAVVKGSENWFFYPKIVGKEVGLHFVWVLMSIIIFGKFFGFWGLLVAIPTAAGFKMYLKDLLDYYKNSNFFKKE